MVSGQRNREALKILIPLAPRIQSIASHPDDNPCKDHDEVQLDRPRVGRREVSRDPDSRHTAQIQRVKTPNSGRRKLTRLRPRPTDLTVTEILYRCGYSNQANFYRRFRQILGLTPEQYRQSLQSHG